jgi:FMN phosphatase YigB (HAD superfamily)
MNGVKAVIFDYGGVLSLDQDNELIQSLASLTGLEMKEFHRLYFGTRGDFDKGVITAEEYWRSFFPLSGKKPDNRTIDRLIALDHSSWARINRDLLAWALQLKEQSYRISILSNMPHEFHKFFINEFRWVPLLEPSVYSCVAGHIKPDPEIYRMSLQALKVAAGEAVFFDDREDNVLAARKQGIHAFRYSSVEQARKDLMSVTSNSQYGPG